MANALATNPWVVDTAAADILFTTDIHVIHFEFANYTAQGSKVEVKDRFGKIVWSATGEDDLSEVRSGSVGWIHGLAVPTLENSGVLRVYFK